MVPNNDPAVSVPTDARGNPVDRAMGLPVCVDDKYLGSGTKYVDIIDFANYEGRAFTGIHIRNPDNALSIHVAIGDDFTTEKCLSIPPSSNMVFDEQLFGHSQGHKKLRAKISSNSGTLASATINYDAVGGITAQQQLIEFSNVPTAGTLTIDYNGDTGDIDFSDNAAAVQTAIRAIHADLAAITVAGDFTAGFTVTMTGVVDPEMFTEDTNTLEIAEVEEIQLIEFDAVPDAGNFRIDYDGAETADIAFNANAAAVQAALRLVAGLGAVTVTGDFTAGFEVVMVGVNSPELLVEGTVNTLENTAVPVVITTSVDTAYVAQAATVVDITETVAYSNNTDIDAPSDGDTVTINGTVFEFCNDQSTSDPDYVKVDINAADQEVSWQNLVTAINNNEQAVTASIDTTTNIITITANYGGTSGNGIQVESDVTGVVVSGNTASGANGILPTFHIW